MIVDSVNYARAAGQAGDLRRRAFLRRLARATAATRSSACERRSPPAPRTSRSATPTAPACRPGRRGDGGRGRGARRAGRGRHPRPQRPRVRGRELARRGRRAGARMVQGTVNGYGERCGNANLVSILPALQLKLGYECVPADRLAAADRDRALRRRAHEHRPRTPTSPTSGATRSPTRAACTSPACRPTRAPSSTWTRSWSATAATC